MLYEANLWNTLYEVFAHKFNFKENFPHVSLSFLFNFFHMQYNLQLNSLLKYIFIFVFVFGWFYADNSNKFTTDSSQWRLMSILFYKSVCSLKYCPADLPIWKDLKKIDNDVDTNLSTAILIITIKDWSKIANEWRKFLPSLPRFHCLWDLKCRDLKVLNKISDI